MKTKNETSSSNGSAELDVLFQETLGCMGDLSAAERLRLREEIRWQIDYAGQYVAYCQEWKGRGSKGKLVRRVISHSTDMKKVSDDLQGLPAKEQAKVVFTFVRAPRATELDPR